MTIILSVLAYFAALFVVGRIVGKSSDNEAFFRANRRSPWPVVAFGMVGASVSGVTFVSVPGMVLSLDMTYLQMCLGFVAGYFVVAFVLLPLYYRLNLTTIYTYLGQRFGPRAYLTGALFFILSKTVGAAVKFYVVCMLLQRYVLDDLGVPFALTAAAMVALMWLYTRRGGMKTIVWTDTFQTLCLLLALAMITAKAVEALGLSPGEAIGAVAASDMSRVFVFDDWLSRQHFVKQFLSGVFVVVVMTGLDQGMMQKNLTCKTLREAQKDVCAYGFAFVPMNLLFLSLGVLLAMLAEQRGMALPTAGDELLPMFAATGELGATLTVVFTIGMVAASCCNADSSLTSLTTSLCVDVLGRPNDEPLRRKAHLGVCLAFALCIVIFRAAGSQSLIDAIYTIASYTYGPLLGLFAFGLFTRRRAADGAVPAIAVASPLLCYAVSLASSSLLNYRFGYELLLLNGLITFLGLWLSGRKSGESVRRA